MWKTCNLYNDHRHQNGKNAKLFLSVHKRNPPQHERAYVDARAKLIICTACATLYYHPWYYMHFTISTHGVKRPTYLVLIIV